LAVTLVTAFLGFGWWQYQRAMEGNDRSWGYTFEWPLFACFVVFMWGKMIYDELHPETGKAVPGKPFAAVPGQAPGQPGEAQGPVLAGVPAVTVSTAEVIARDEKLDPQVAAYNRYLARLAAENKR
jgi:hypothetical protein